MADHLSMLAIDEAVAGLPLDAGAQAHLGSCLHCRARVERATAAKARFLAAHPALPAPASNVVPLRRSYAPLLGAFAAAALVVLIARAPPADDRLKGRATVELRDATGAPVREAPVGARVMLTLGAAGHRYARVTSGGAEVWRGEVPAGAAAKVAELEVTPGSLTLEACFADRAEFSACAQTASWRLEVRR